MNIQGTFIYRMLHRTNRTMFHRSSMVIPPLKLPSWDFLNAEESNLYALRNSGARIEFEATYKGQSKK